MNHQKITDMNYQDKIKQTERYLVLNRKRIMKRAWYLFNTNKFYYPTFKDALCQVWEEVNKYRAEKKQRLAELEEGYLNHQRSKWNVEPKPEFWMARSIKNNPNLIIR